MSIRSRLHEASKSVAFSLPRLFFIAPIHVSFVNSPEFYFSQGVRHSRSKRLQQLVSDGPPDDDPSSDAVSDQLATWQEGAGEGADRLINLMKEQVIMARAYTMLAQQGGDQQLARQLRGKRKELQRMLAGATGGFSGIAGIEMVTSFENFTRLTCGNPLNSA